MSANTFGQRLQMMSFGESHGPAYGVVIDGMPAGVKYDEALLLKNLARRKPGASSFVTARSESDQPEILSGFYEGKSLGTPIAVVVRNENQRSADYDKIQNEARIGHADDTWKNKFGHSDHRGGGRSSGRETLNRVIAGSFAQMLMQQLPSQVLTGSASPIQVFAYAKQIGNITLDEASPELPKDIQTILEKAKADGESYGGVVECRISQPPANLGQPVFHKFKADLAQAMMSLGATTGFELGAGFEGTTIKGTEFHEKLLSENYGGIRGGITTGEDIIFRVGFKPTSSIKDVAKKGRHDPCIIPRAIPVIEAICWHLLADHWLWCRNDRV
jgi:chorismate synthase